MSKKQSRRSTTLQREQYLRLQAVCRERNIPLSQLIWWLVEMYLEDPIDIEVVPPSTFSWRTFRQRYPEVSRRQGETLNQWWAKQKAKREAKREAKNRECQTDTLALKP